MQTNAVDLPVICKVVQKKRRKPLPYRAVQWVDQAIMTHAVALNVLSNCVAGRATSEDQVRVIAQAINLVHQADKELMQAKGIAGREESD